MAWTLLLIVIVFVAPRGLASVVEHLRLPQRRQHGAQAGAVATKGEAA